MLVEQVATILHQVEAQNVVVRKLEEKERILQNNLATVEKELRSVCKTTSLISVQAALSYPGVGVQVGQRRVASPVW